MPRTRPTLRRLVPAVLALACLASCGGGGGGGVVAGFRVTTTDPADGAQGVAVDAVVLVSFSDPVDEATVTSASLRVGVIGGQGEIPGTAVVHGEGGGRVLRWTPTSTLAPLASHSCIISGALRSTGGDLVEGDLDFTFRTGAGDPGITLPPRESLRRTLERLHVGRRSHTATHLQAGIVLIAGGFTQGTSITDRAETYVAERFTLLAARLVQERAGHAAVLLGDGKVLLAGGYYEVSVGQLATTASAELYDPSSGGFRPVGPMTTERVDHAMFRLPDGRVLVTGGSQLQGTFLADLDSAEVYDPTTETFTALPASMTHTRATHAMLDVGAGRLLLLGGSDTDVRPEHFLLASETFVPLAAAAQEEARFGAMAATFASHGAVLAGGDSLGGVVYVDGPTGFSLNTGSSLSVPRAYGTATRIAPDQILVTGGIDFSRGTFLLNSVDLIAEGGIAGSRTFVTDMFFQDGMAFHTATALPDGTVMFCGGLNATGGLPELDDAYLFELPAP